MKTIICSKKYSWILSGSFWGVFMFAFMELLYPYHNGEAFSSTKLISGFLQWFFLGLVLFFIINKYVYKSNKQQ